MRVFALAIGLGVLLAAGAGGAAVERKAEPTAGSTVPAQALARAITPKRLKAHLTALAAIAGRNGGTRAVGTSGYSDSVAYVTRQLRAVGYRPKLKTFSFDFFRETKPTVFERVAPGLRRFENGQDFVTIRYSGGGDVTAQVFPVDFAGSSSGCEASDFAGFPTGAVALMKRGGCRFSDKAAVAQASRRRGSADRQRRLAGTHRPADGHAPRAGNADPGADRLGRSRLRPRGVGAATPDASADRPLGYHDAGAGRERNRRPAGSKERGRPARRASRLGFERARHQRQRIGLGARPRGCPPGPAAPPSAEARPAVRLLGWRGDRARRFDELRAEPEREPTAPDPRRSQFRHGRLAELRAHRLQRRRGASGLTRGSKTRSARTSRLGGYRWKRSRSTAPPTIRRSRRPASRSGGCSRAQTKRRRLQRPSTSAGRSTTRSTPATTRRATRSRTSTSAFSSRWPTQGPL